MTAPEALIFPPDTVKPADAVIRPDAFNVVVAVDCRDVEPAEIVSPDVPVINPLEFNVVVAVACNEVFPEIVNVPEVRHNPVALIITLVTGTCVA